MNWRHLDPADLEREVSPSSVLGGKYQPFIEADRRNSRAAHERLSCLRDVRYGEGPRALLDFFPAPQTPAPLLIFIHGGYWQELGKEDSAVLAGAWHGAGYAHAVIDYDLAPQATLAGIVAQCRQALQYLRGQAQSLGFDPARIVLAGSSAGAHLAAMLCLADAADVGHRTSGVAVGDAASRWAPPIHAALLLSGVYELEPLLRTSVNQALHLDAAQAQVLSPLNLLNPPTTGDETPGPQHAAHLRRFPRSLLAWGDNETRWFKSQSEAFAQALQQRGACVQMQEVTGRHHFDLVDALGDAGHPLFQQCLHFVSN